MTMNEYHDRPADDPYQSAEDRPVAGWPGHEPGESTDEHTGEHAGQPADDRTDEHTDEPPLEGEPLVGEAGTEHDPGSGLPGGRGRHEQTDDSVFTEAGEPETTDRERVSEPFGTEEPIIVTDSEETEPEETEPEPVATEPHEDAEPDAEPVQADAEPEAEPVPEAARPAAGNDLAIENLLDAETAGRFQGRWREVKGVFVDDPSDAVRQASALVGDAVDELTAALARLRQGLDSRWEEGKETDTERLRVALRAYGTLIDRILSR